MPDAYNTSTRGLNDRPPGPGIAGSLAGMLGRVGGAGYGFGRGYYGGFPNRFRASGRFPGMDLPPPEGTENLDQTQGPYDPEKLFGVRDRYQPPLERLRAMSDAAGWSRGLPMRQGGLSQGAGFGAPSDMFRRLLMARLSGGRPGGFGGEF